MIQYKQQRTEYFSQNIMTIMYILVLYMILIFINQNNLKQQQQVSMNQTVKFLML